MRAPAWSDLKIASCFHSLGYRRLLWNLGVGWQSETLQRVSKPSLCGDLTILTIPLTLRLVAISLQEELGSHWGWRFSVAYDKGRNYAISLKSQHGWRKNRCGGVKGMKQMPMNPVHQLTYKWAYSWEHRQASVFLRFRVMCAEEWGRLDAQLSWNSYDC